MKEQGPEGKNEGFFWARAVWIDQHGLGATFSAKRAVNVQHRGHSILKGFGIFQKASGIVLQLLDYPDILPESFIGEFLRFALLTFEIKKALKKKTTRTLCSPVLNGGDERRGKREQVARRAQ